MSQLLGVLYLFHVVILLANTLGGFLAPVPPGFSSILNKPLLDCICLACSILAERAQKAPSKVLALVLHSLQTFQSHTCIE